MKYIVVINYHMNITPLVRIFENKEEAIAYAEKQGEKGLKYSIYLMTPGTVYPIEMKSNY